MVAFFILANSFFVAAEFALVSVRETRMEQLIALGRPGARTVLQLKHNIDEFLPAVQFGVTLAALALGGIGEPAVADVMLRVLAQLAWLPGVPAHAVLYAHTVAVVMAFAVITYFEVLLGELVPKSLALQRAERIALAVAGPMDVFIRMTRPAVKADECFGDAGAAAVSRAAAGGGRGALAGGVEADGDGDAADGAAAAVSGRDDPSRDRAEPCDDARDHDAAGKDFFAAGGYAAGAGERADCGGAALAGSGVRSVSVGRGARLSAWCIRRMFRG